AGVIRARHKLLGQISAALLVVPFIAPFDHVEIFGSRVELGWLAGPLALLWLLGAVNSMNLLDGMDGLLGTVSVLIAIALPVRAVLRGDWVGACLAGVMAGAVLGFLRYNAPPASIFLGDAGSMLLGLLLGALALRCTQQTTGTVPLAVPMALFALPIFDTAVA